MLGYNVLSIPVSNFYDCYVNWLYNESFARPFSVFDLSGGRDALTESSCECPGWTAADRRETIFYLRLENEDNFPLLIRRMSRSLTSTNFPPKCDSHYHTQPLSPDITLYTRT